MKGLCGDVILTRQTLRLKLGIKSMKAAGGAVPGRE